MSFFDMGNTAISAKPILLRPKDTVAEPIHFETVISYDLPLYCMITQISDLEVRFFSEEDFRERIEEREISVNDLVRAITMDENTIRNEVRELLRSYDVPLEHTDELISWVRERVRSKIRDLPYEGLVLDALTKLYIHIAYELLHG